MQKLIETARSHALKVMEGEVLANKHKKPNRIAKPGFSIGASEEDINTQHVILHL